jgi:phospholipase C
MKIFRYALLVLVSLAAPAFATVTISSPQAGATVSSPVSFVATGTTTCAAGVGSMGIFVNNQQVYSSHGAAQINTQLSLAAGYQHTVVQEWDKCGGSSYATANITVSSSSPSPGQTGVVVTSPAPNSTVSSPVNYVASASTNTCAAGVSSMGIYVNNKLVYFAKGAQQINTQLSLTAGYEHTVVEEWDKCGGAAYTTVNLTVSGSSGPTVTLTANPPSISSGSSSTLTATATNATQVVITGTDGSMYSLPGSGGTQSVSPNSTTTYTAQASGSQGSVTTTITLSVVPAGSANAIQHVIFMMQENHSFDNYFGMLNPYRAANSTNGQAWNKGDDGETYTVDGIDDKLATISNQDDEGDVFKLYDLTTTCIDDDSSAWQASFGDVTRYNLLATRKIHMDGFVHNAEGFAKACANNGNCDGQFTDLTGERAMGYYDQKFLNYYYYMASQFAISDRWFSPVASKSISNRIAVYTGGTTQGLVQDPGSNDHLNALNIETIFQELDAAKVSWKVYYTSTDGYCFADGDCPGTTNAAYPAIYLTHLTYGYKYVHGNPSQATCAAPTQPSSVVGDSTNSFCIDPNHIAPLSQYYKDLTGGALPSFAFIEAGYGLNDEHPGSTTSILGGQAQVAKVVNAFMASPEWKNSVFFFSYDEGGGPYDHVPPVPGHSNDFTAASMGTIPDISSIAVNADSYQPCVPPTPGTATLHCDLLSSWPGAHSGDAAAVYGFAAQLGFRVPNFVVSPFARKHYVSHVPMDHTAIIKFVENRFIGPSAHLTARDAAQPNLLDFFDFANTPWATPPTPPTPASSASLGYNPCQPTNVGP